jgi:hypothetical protein
MSRIYTSSPSHVPWRVAGQLYFFIINEEVTKKRMTNYTNTVELRNTGEYLYKVRCKRENKLVRYKDE